MINYTRVIPRDFFNESKLLKCLGQLSLEILDGELCDINIKEMISNPEEGFKINQNPMDGSVFCDNYLLEINDNTEITPFTILNSKDSYPLYIQTEEDEIRVLDNNGKITKEFKEFCSRL